jgi:hypothetical protein
MTAACRAATLRCLLQQLLLLLHLETLLEHWRQQATSARRQHHR